MGNLEGIKEGDRLRLATTRESHDVTVSYMSGSQHRLGRVVFADGTDALIHEALGKSRLVSPGRSVMLESVERIGAVS